MRLNFDRIKRENIFPGESGGDYGALLGWQNRPGRQFEDIDLTNMTVDEAIDFAGSKGEYAAYSRRQVGRTATPMGAFQIVGTTLKGLRDSGRISGDTRLTEDAQDYLGQVILERQGSGAWEGWRGGRIKPGSFKAPATFEEYKAQRGLNVPEEFVRQVEEAGRVQPMPVDTSMQGLFATPSLPGVDGSAPTQRQGVPIARRDNPANPSFPDNAVGPLSQRDYGYQTAKTVEDLRAAIDPNYSAPEVPSTSLTGVGNAGVGGVASATGGIDVGGLFGPATSDVANSRIANAFEDAAQPNQPQTPSYPEPRQIASVPADRLDQTFGLFDPGAETVATSDVQQIEPQQSPLQPLAPSQTVAPRQVAQPQEPRLDLVPNAAPSVADSVSGYGLFGDAGDGYSYGYSPWGSGVAKVHDSADERTKIAATGPGLFGAFNKEFGTNIGLSPGKMMTPLASALGAGAAVAGLGPLALAIPAANALGGTNWLASKMDAVPREQWQQPRQNNNFLSNLFNGNPLQNFAGGLFSAPQKAANGVGGLFGGNSNQNEVSFNGPIGRNQRDVSLDSMSQAARNEIERATRGLY